ncbi:MAG: Na+:H+ antiporter, NhaA family [Actinomycetota bacterium]|nr:Na+:H+ antiporter, NhaA family [Actinomycetota bacterium]
MATEEDSMFSRPSLSERVWLLRVLREETVGGVLLLVAAAIALLMANSPAGDFYTELSDTVVGPASLHLDLTLNTWAADGLLAVFFFIAGLELKHELVLGTLADRRKAAVPVAAAIGGMVVPAVIYFAVNAVDAAGDTSGWGIPMATDIAFALAVLAVVGRHLPVALRAFLLTLAVVDDLGAILVIALFYSDSFKVVPFVAAVALLGLYAWLQHMRVRSAFIYVPLALAVWVLVHDSGIHATVAGVALGLLTRVRADPGEQDSPAERLQRRIQPLSAGFCVPVFAFFAAGVDLRGADIVTTLTSPVAVGIMAGLVLGKPIGVFGGAWLTARFTRASLSSSLVWRDILAVGFIAGIGFTVSLLIAELAFEDADDLLSSAKVAVLGGSVLAALIASIALVSRSRVYARLAEDEDRDEDGDGIPDVYQRPAPKSG